MKQVDTIQIQHLLAENKTAEALDQLLKQDFSNDWKETILLLKANLLNTEKQLTEGVIDYAAGQLQLNRINSGALKILTHLETGSGDPEKILADFKEKYAAKNVVTNSTKISDSDIEINNSKGVVIGSGNTVTQKIFSALGKKQFWVILGVLLLIGVVGIWGGKKLFAQQEGHYHSLNEIKKELATLADLNKNVKNNLEEKGTELNDWLEKGMQAMKDQDYTTAVQYLEQVSKDLPSATIHQNLSVAYRELGNEEKSKTHLNRASKINPAIKLPMNYATLKGKRINLLLPKNGGEILIASHEDYAGFADEKEENILMYDGNEVTYGFMDGKKTTFDMFAIVVRKTSGYNLKEFELFHGNDSPTGAFNSIGTFTTNNNFMAKTPYQEFKFKKVTAKYFKLKAISNHSSRNNYSHIREIQLWGEIN